MKPLQMDILDFSDHFSYITYFIWSYRLISMIFQSFGYFLEFPNHLELEIIQENDYIAIIASCRRQQINRAGPGQT